MKIICMIRALCLGGAERQLVGLAVQLGAAGHSVEVLTYHPGDFYADQLEAAGVRHTLIPKDRHIVRNLAEHFRNEKPDCVIAFLVGPGIKACRAAKLYGDFRLVVSERNVNTWLGPHDSYRFRLFRKRADVIVANSHSQSRWIAEHFPACRGKLATVVNFVDTKKFSPAGHSASEGIGSRKVRRIVTTARLNPRKNVLGYIRALGLLKASGVQFEAVWYGLAKEDRHYRKCLKAIRKNGLEGCFRILPATKDVLSAYRNADIFCLPSFYEGTPNSLAEALACGLPCAVSDVSDNSRYVPADCLFDPKSPVQTASVLRSLLEDGNLSSRSLASRQTALDLLSKEAFTKKYLEIVQGSTQ